MKFTVSVPDLQYAVRLVKDVAPSTSAVAEHAGVLIVADGSCATFTASNTETLARATVRAEVETTGRAVVDAAAIYSAIARFKPINDKGVGTSDLTIVASPRARELRLTAVTKYASGNKTPHKRGFPLRNHEFFPEVPSPENVKKKLTVPAGLLMDGLESIAYAVSSDKNFLLYTGVRLNVSDSRLLLAGTDGICVAEYTVPVDYTGEPIELVVPGSFASKITRSFFDDDVLDVGVTNNRLFVSTQNLVLGGTLIKENYPDYSQLFDVSGSSAIFDKHVLIDNLLNLSYEANQASENRVSIKVKDSSAELLCGLCSNDNIPVKFDGELDFSVNLKLFMLSAKSILGDDLELVITSPTSPILFKSSKKSPAGAEFSCILVPLSPER